MPLSMKANGEAAKTDLVFSAQKPCSPSKPPLLPFIYSLFISPKEINPITLKAKNLCHSPHQNPVNGRQAPSTYIQGYSVSPGPPVRAPTYSICQGPDTLSWEARRGACLLLLSAVWLWYLCLLGLLPCLPPTQNICCPRGLSEEP